MKKFFTVLGGIFAVLIVVAAVGRPLGSETLGVRLDLLLFPCI